MNISGSTLAQAGNICQVTAQAGRDKQAAGRDPPAVGEKDPERAPAVGDEVGDGAFDDLTAVAVHLTTAGGREVGRRDAVAGQVAVHMCGWSVARRTGIHHENRAPGPRKHQGGGQSRGASTDDHYVVLAHVPTLKARGVFTYERCRLWETGVR